MRFSSENAETLKKEKALGYCRRAAETRPESKTISSLLAELEGGEGD
jgi:hypothetical protein